MAFLRRAADTLDREALFAIGLRILPEFRDLRSSAVGQIALRILEDKALEGQGLPLSDFTRVPEVRGKPRLRYGDLQPAIEQLKAQGFVEISGKWTRPRSMTVSLTDLGREHLQEQAAATDTMIDAVLEELCGNDRSLRTALLDLLCHVFSDLGRGIVGVLVKRHSLGAVLPDRLLERKASDIARAHEGVASQTLLDCASAFFRNDSPSFVGLKWYLARAYCVVRMLGSGKGLSRLSLSILSGKQLYLDTNVLFPALLDGMEHHEATQILERACREAGARLFVSSATTREYEQSAESQILDAYQLGFSIPADVADRISDPVFHYLRQARELPATADEALTAFLRHTLSQVEADHAIRIDRDPWFDEVVHSKDLAPYIDAVQASCKHMWGHEKIERVATHDAVMLFHTVRSEGKGVDTAFLTLDRTLPCCDVSGVKSAAAHVALLPALMQWISPILGRTDTEDGRAAALSVALEECLLPAKNTYRLREFRSLDDLGIRCDQLPEEDVRNCIRHLRRMLPNYDLSSADDREVLAQKMREFINAPERVFQQELQVWKDRALLAEKRADRFLTIMKAVKQAGFALLLLGLGIGLAYMLGEGSGFLKRILNYWLLSSAAGPLAILAHALRSRRRDSASG